jgi:hypothetical protein
MKTFITKILAPLAIFCISCENEMPSVIAESGLNWRTVPSHKLEGVKDWYVKRIGSGKDQRQAPLEVMWGTALYSQKGPDQLVFSAFVADSTSDEIKNIYLFKREDGYSGYILGHQSSASTKGSVDGNFTGQLTMYDLEGEIKTSSILKNGKAIQAKNVSGLTGMSNLRTAIEDDPIMLQEITITATRIESNTTWIILSSVNYFDLSSTFPGYRYEGYVGGEHHYAAPTSSSQRPRFVPGDPAGDPIDMPCVASQFFNDNKQPRNYEVTIFVDQPEAGTRETWAYVGDDGDVMSVGHTFFQLTKNNMDGTRIQYIVGYYPMNGSIDPLAEDYTDVGGFRNDNARNFDVSITYPNLQQWKFHELLDFLSSMQNTTYDLRTQNCSDIGLRGARQLGQFLPDTQGTWPGGSGSNPGDLGEDIRNLANSSSYSRNLAGGTASTNTPNTCR